MFEMLTGDPPFYASNSKKLYQMIMTKKPKYPRWLSSECVSLMKGFLERNVERRLGSGKSTMFKAKGVRAIKEHAYFKGLSWYDLADMSITPPLHPSVCNAEDVSNFSDEYTSQAVIDSPVTRKMKRHLDQAPPDIFDGFSYVAPGLALPPPANTWAKVLQKSLNEEADDCCDHAEEGSAVLGVASVVEEGAAGAQEEEKEHESKAAEVQGGDAIEEDDDDPDAPDNWESLLSDEDDEEKEVTEHVEDVVVQEEDDDPDAPGEWEALLEEGEEDGCNDADVEEEHRASQHLRSEVTLKASTSIASSSSTPLSSRELVSTLAQPTSDL